MKRLGELPQSRLLSQPEPTLLKKWQRWLNVIKHDPREGKFLNLKTMLLGLANQDLHLKTNSRLEMAKMVRPV